MAKKQAQKTESVVLEQVENNPVEEKCEGKCSEQKFNSDLLAKSEALKHFGLHRDIIRAILTKKEYTIHDAEVAIQRYVDSFIG